MQPVLSERGPAAIAPLPFEAPPELSVTASAASARSVVAQDDGWLVAMDRGEFGAGLYWVERGTNRTQMQTQRLDSSLSRPVRWVVSTESAVVAVAGLCHGDVCSQRTSLYEIVRSIDREWHVEPLAVFEGCPAAIGSSAGGAALLVAAACGGLQRIERRGARAIASWPNHLYPIQVLSVRAAAADETYLVSFGRVAARFSGADAEWFAPRHCIDVERNSDGHCACIAAEP